MNLMEAVPNKSIITSWTIIIVFAYLTYWSILACFFIVMAMSWAGFETSNWLRRGRLNDQDGDDFQNA